MYPEYLPYIHPTGSFCELTVNLMVTESFYITLIYSILGPIHVLMYIVTTLKQNSSVYSFIR